MWNFFLGYLFARSVAGEEAARAGVLIVLLTIAVAALAVCVSLFDLFAPAFRKGVGEGLHQWEHFR